jgi:superfamily II DNA or RNA helicase
MKVDILVKKLNETSCQVFAEESIYKEISDNFKFWIPSAIYQKSYKEKLWDGYIRLYNKGTSTLPLGLESKLKSYAESNDFSYVIEGFDEPLNISEEELLEYIKTLNLTSDKEPITPYEFQVKGILHALRNRRCILKSPTSSGKSLIIYIIINYLKDHVLPHDKKILLVVPTIGLVNQMYYDFSDYSYAYDKFDVSKECHKIMAGKEKSSSQKIYISTFQSIYKLPESYFNQFGAILCDEAHRYRSSEISKILEKSVNTKYKIGTTGTVGNCNIDILQLQGLFGEVITLTTNKEQMDSGRSATLSIKILHLKESSEEKCKIVSGLAYKDEIDILKSSMKRKLFITKLALSRKSTTLVLFTGNAYGKELFKMIQKDSKVPVYFVDGTIHQDIREEIRKKANVENCILVCSFETFSTGINIKNLENLIFASPSKSEIRVLQSIGRIIRKGISKFVTFFDIVDDFSYKKKNNYALQHFLSRIEYYNKEQFEYQIKKIEY